MSKHKCSKCLIIKDFENFPKNKTKSFGIQSWCLACTRDYKKSYRENNKEKIDKVNKKWVLANIDKYKETKKAYYEKNKNDIKTKAKAYQTRRKYLRSLVNNKKIAAAYVKLKRSKDVQLKLRSRLRIRLWSAIKNTQKVGSAVQDLGCSVDELKNYLESKFQPGMTGENWGNKKEQWSIDHIKPLSKFDLSNREEFVTACHYTNLQPLWHIDNIKKKDKWDKSTI